MPKSTVHGGVTNEALEQSHRTGQPPELEPELWGDKEPEDAEVPPAADNGKEPGPARPAVNDPKDRWVEYAVSWGWTEEDAQAATKADLIEKTKDL